jgi:hypothetical protein
MLGTQDKIYARTGLGLRILIVAFLVFDAGIKLVHIAPVTESFNHLGYSPALATPVGIIGLVCAALYSFRSTAILGAILITGLCGGAIASHLRIGSPMPTHVLFGMYVSVIAWCSLWLTDERLRQLVPVRRG